MRKLALCIVLLLPFVYIYSQDLDYYYLEIKEGHELGEIQKTVNADQTLTLSMENTAFAAALNEKPIYVFEKAFPSSQRSLLQRVYILSVPNNTIFSSLSQRQEIEILSLIEDNNV